MKVTNWGGYPVADANFVEPENAGSVKHRQESLQHYIARGLGRCYGDSALSGNIIGTGKLNRFLSFDNLTGVLKCEAGVSMAEVLEVFVPRGWFVPVTPGTKYVTIGGAVAADVHGKNHHKEGSFRKHVLELDLLLPNGEITTCSLTQNEELFNMTCGGMGLSGTILTVTFRLKKIETSYIDQTSYKAKNLDDAFRAFEETKHFTYSVSWIDCLARGKNIGKSVLMVGEHARLADIVNSPRAKNPLKVHGNPKLNMPVNLPPFALNAFTIKAFNLSYYGKARHRHRNIIHYEPFFYPLDSIHNWNRMYGKPGFVQYQFVLPLENSYDGLQQILEKIAAAGQGSFLAVLKLFGKQYDLLSFPMEGYTLALDFPVNQRVFRLLDELDELVMKHNGRIYLAKDARMKPEVFRSGYGNLAKFEELKRQFDPQNKLRSLQSDRLKITQ